LPLFKLDDEDENELFALLFVDVEVTCCCWLLGSPIFKGPSVNASASERVNVDETSTRLVFVMRPRRIASARSNVRCCCCCCCCCWLLIVVNLKY
jgi:hypothetical protein